MDAALTASEIFANAARFTDAYYVAIQPLCERSGLPPMAVDILMFLANNPGHGTAGELLPLPGDEARDRLLPRRAAGAGGLSAAAERPRRPPENRAGLHAEGGCAH